MQSRKYNKRAGRISTSGRHAGMEVWRPWLVSPGAPSPSKPTHRSGTEAHPGHAEEESNAGNGRTLAPAPQTWLYPLSGKPVPGHAQAGDVPAAKGQNNLQGKAIRTDAVSGQRVQVDVKVVPMKCLTNPEERLYQYTAIDEYTTPSLSGRISRTKHLLLR